MIDPSFLKFFRCPIYGTPLHVADESLIRQINAAITTGQLRNDAGQVLAATLCGGLINEDQSVLYPVRQQIPCLIASEAIRLDQPCLRSEQSDSTPLTKGRLNE